MTKKITNSIISGSFRDPSGFVYLKDGLIYRRINNIYKDNYNQLIDSGLYQALTDKKLLIPHKEVIDKTPDSNNAYKTIRPEIIPFISYPYEWCFSQLKDAALTTLKIQKKALEFEMTLKDCSVYNIQFYQGKPVLIDTLSFEKYQEGRPWVAYKQFCQHFLAPLALISYKDMRLSQLFCSFIDGLPLDLTSSLLPLRTYFNFPLLTHLHLHAKSQKHFADKTINKKTCKISQRAFFALINNLESVIKKLKSRISKTEWGEYYSFTNYSQEALINKQQIISDFLDLIRPETVWDLGANTGLFSRIASNKGIKTISFDIDQRAVEKNYLESVQKNEINILPLFLDLTNPSPGLGWAHQERMSLAQRGPANTVMALALIHHLAISNNLPFAKIAEFFHKIGNTLIMEFIPKTDSNAQKLLSTREDIFPDYTQQDFEKEFSQYFSIQDIKQIKDSNRILYLMRRREA